MRGREDEEEDVNLKRKRQIALSGEVSLEEDMDRLRDDEYGEDDYQYWCLSSGSKVSVLVSVVFSRNHYLNTERRSNCRIQS
jgi:hypothetical protein